jgi:ABC-type oligopeptide transport system ATPase subunit
MSTLTVNNISKTFNIERGFFKTTNSSLKALDGVSISVKKGSILGVVGESGSGKTTLGKAIVRLLHPEAGVITIDGVDINSFSRKDYSKKVQMIFQDPFSSLNPKLDIQTSLSEASDLADPDETYEVVLKTLGNVGLDKSVLISYPHQFSGGQRQRIALARALMKKPDFIIADEPLSSLDVSIGNQLLNLFLDLKCSGETTFVFISHDIAATSSISDYIVVMKNGRIVEQGETTEVIGAPKEDYTKNLIAAVPV